jgi:hypothetical protein
MNFTSMAVLLTLSVLSSSSSPELSTGGGEVAGGGAVAWPRPTLLMAKVEGCVETALRRRLCDG